MANFNNQEAGIIRTASGRNTYAPDGLMEDHTEEYETGLVEKSSDEDLNYEPIRTSKYKPTTAPSDGFFEGSSDSTATPTMSRTQSRASFHQSERQNLERLITNDRRLSKIDTLANLEDDDPVLDPKDKDFDLYKWVRKFMQGFDESGIKSLRAGIVFKDLSVSGSGAALQLQQTVASMLLSPIRDISFGHKNHKQILNKFDGVLKSGELLIVLGRPGSGCSTFLKSLCGELHGLNLEEGSTIHYNGDSIMLLCPSSC